MQGAHENRRKNILLIRGVLTLVIIMLAALNHAAIFEGAHHITAYLAIAVLSNFALMAVKPEKFEDMRLHYVIFLFDIILVTLGAYWLAYLDFRLFMVIFLTVFMAALTKSVKMSLVVAGIVNTVYFYMRFSAAGPEESVLDDRALLNIPFIFMVALHASFFSEQAEAELGEKKRLENSNLMLSMKLKDAGSEMEKVVEFTERIYDSFREGVIITDNFNMVWVYNKACEYTFNVRKSKVLNNSFMDMAFLGPVREMIAQTKTTKRVVIDETAAVDVAGVEKQLLVNTSFIKDPRGEVTGILCTVELLLDGIKRKI